MDYLQYKNYLMHHGVEGQKWGVRRWQNADGSLTAEGRIHYGLGNLDYNARYSGDKKSAVKAYKAERKQLREKVAQVEFDDDEKLWNKYDDFYKGKGEYSNIDPGDPGAWRNAEKDLNAESDAMWNSYQKGLEEVDKYLTGKYGQETIDSYKRGKKAKTIALGASIVAASAVVGVGVWHGNKAHKNNELRKEEDDLYNKLKDSNDDYQHAKSIRQMAKDDEMHLREKSDESTGELYEFLMEKQRNRRNGISGGIDDANKEGWLRAQAAVDKAYYDAAKDETDKAYNDMINTRIERERAGNKYRDKAAVRMEKTKGLWARPSDKARNARRTYANDYEKG